MDRAVEVGSCRATSGTTASGSLVVGYRPDGCAIEVPVLIACGREPGPCIWINGSIHGDEPEGPLAILTLFRQLDPSTMRGTVIGIPVLNTMAFEACERGNPYDTFTYDMNRIYPGKPDGFLSERIAYAHYVAMKEQADLEISIHSGGAHSYLAQAAIFSRADKSLELAKALGPSWNLLLRSFATKGSPNAVMAELGKGGVTIELGGLCDTLPDRYLDTGGVLADTIMNVLRHFHVVDGEPRYANRWLIGSAEVMPVQQSGLWIPERRIPLRQPVKAGTLVATVVNLTGKVLEEVRTVKDCVIFGIRTRPQIFAGDWAVFYSVIETEVTA